MTIDACAAITGDKVSKDPRAASFVVSGDRLFHLNFGPPIAAPAKVSNFCGH